MTSDLYGTPTQGSDGNILMEFVLMERLWADSSGQDSYDPYTCAVNSALFLECLDIAGPRTLGNSLSDSVAYNMSGSAGDLNKNFYAVLALEGLFNMTGGNVSSHFGGDVSCSGKVVGDGAVNAYDIATLMWYQFKFEPYDQLPNDPSTVATVQGRDDTGYRCNLGETRRMWQLAVGEDYCHSGQNAAMLGYDSQRRLSQSMVPEQSILSANLFEAYRSEPIRPKFRQLEAPSGSTTIDARETRTPSARRSAINREDMLRHVNAMRTLDVDVAEWGVVEGYGRWIRMRAPGVQVAMELYLAGISVDEPVHLSMQSVPTKNCTMCKPVDEDPRKVVVAFARRTEYEDEYANAVSVSEEDLCASIVPATVQSSVMLGNTIALRQQPPNRACGFDLFLWVPAFPATGVHVSKQASPYSFSARRLAAVGAESPLMTVRTGCDSDIGVLAGSSAMDGFRGQIQRVSSCARYGFTQPEVIKPVVTAIVPVGQCAAMSCNAHAPARSDVVSRSFHLFASSGLESAYSSSLQMLTMSQRSFTTHKNVHATEYYMFESMLARDSQGNNCCSGYVCTTTIDVNGTSGGICQLQTQQEAEHSLSLPSPPSHPPSHPPVRPPSHPPPSPPPSAPPSTPPPMREEVEFGVVLAGGVNYFNYTDFKLRVSAAARVPTSCIELKVQAGGINVTATIRPEYNSSVNAVNIKYNLLNAINNETAASEVLGVTVEKIFAAPDVYLNYYSPPPLSPPFLPPMLMPPSDEENDLGLILGPTLGVLAAVIWFAGMAVWCYSPRAKTTPENAERQGLTATAVGKKMTLPLATKPLGSDFGQNVHNKASRDKARSDEHARKLANAFVTGVSSTSPRISTFDPKQSGKEGSQERVQKHVGAGSVPLLSL